MRSISIHKKITLLQSMKAFTTPTKINELIVKSEYLDSIYEFEESDTEDGGVAVGQFLMKIEDELEKEMDQIIYEIADKITEKSRIG